jgi:conjugal transfer mating pair stabilization protein TraG
MRIQWKDSVRFTDLHPAMILAAIRASMIFESFGVPAVVTSGNDSQHMEGSLHFAGRALDFRTKHMSGGGSAFSVRDQLRVALGPTFTVLLEDFGQANEHLHVQYNG